MTIQDVLYYLIWAGFFFLMMRSGCGAHIMGHGHHHSTSKQDQVPRSVGVSELLPAQAADPVCGMTVQTSTAKTAAYLGQVYYFCSETCRVKFEAAPVTYVKVASGSSATEEAYHAS